MLMCFVAADTIVSILMFVSTFTLLRGHTLLILQ